MSYGGRDDRNNKVGSMIIVIVAAMLTWVISFLIIRAISRYREFAADRGAAHMTGEPVKLASALLKISSNMRQIPTKDLRHVEGLNTFLLFLHYLIAQLEISSPLIHQLKNE